MGSGLRRESKTTKGARGGSGATILDGGEAAWLGLKGCCLGLQVLRVGLEGFSDVRSRTHHRSLEFRV